MVVVLWLWWSIEHYTDFRIRPRKSRGDSEPIDIMFALIGTPLILIGSLIWWKRDVGIAANGVSVTATIEKKGKSVSGMRNITLRYSVNDVSYKVKKSFSSIDFDDKNEGDLVDVIADKRNPKKVMLDQ